MVSCPCCGDDMSPELVTCWTCYRWSGQLNPGAYVDHGALVTITADTIAEWEARRVSRTTGASVPTDKGHKGHYSHLGGLWFCDTCNSPYCDLA